MAANLQLPADVESWPAQRVVEYVLAEFPDRVALACSFQKEETVLLDLLFALDAKARVFAIDMASVTRRAAAQQNQQPRES